MGNHVSMSTIDVIGAREAEEILGVAHSTLQRWVKQGRIDPVRKIPGLRGPYLFSRSDVEAFADSRKKARA